MSQHDALASLVSTPPRQYLQRTDAGTSILQELHQQCVEAGLVLATATATDDISRLHALFDVCLDHGLGSLVLDYVSDVCADRLLTSSDPVAAFLLDGECVRRWCQKTLAISKGRITSWLGRGLGFIASSGMLPKELAKLRALRLVTLALSPAAAGATGSPQQQQGQQGLGAGEAADVEEVERLIQCGTVLAWLSRLDSAGLDRPCGRYPSEAEWRSAASKRKAGAHPATLFVADMLAALAAEGVPGLQYPLAGVERLVQGLFLAGRTCQRAWHAKLCLLAYWLADGGFAGQGPLAEGFSAAFQVPPQLSLSWVLRLYLDEASSTGHSHGQGSRPGANRAVAVAAALLPEVDGAQLPFKALQVFLRHGAPAAALGLLRQRGGAGAGASPAAAGGALGDSGQGSGLEEAGVGVAVLLESGLLAEAYMEVKRHLGCLPPGTQQQRQHAQQLVAQLLGWGLEAGQLNSIIRLPLGPVEEQVCCEWLAGHAPTHPQCGLILSLFYLLRGRTPEALLAYAQHCPATGEAAASETQQALAELLRQAGSALPAVQRALTLRQAPKPAVVMGLEVEAQQGGALLAASVPLMPGDGQEPILSEGPTPLQAPLVGSVPALLALKAWQDAERDGAVAQALLPGGPLAGGQEASAGAAVNAAGPSATAAVPRQLFQQQQQQQAGEAAAAAPVAQQPPLKGFLSGGLLGAAGGPPSQQGAGGRFGGFARPRGSAAAGAGVGAAGGVVGSSGGSGLGQQVLPEGLVGERDFDRLLGLAPPAAKGRPGRPLRGSRLVR